MGSHVQGETVMSKRRLLCTAPPILRLLLLLEISSKRKENREISRGMNRNIMYKDWKEEMGTLSVT